MFKITISLEFDEDANREIFLKNFDKFVEEQEFELGQEIAYLLETKEKTS